MMLAERELFTVLLSKLVSNREVPSTISRDMLDNFFMDFG